MSGVVSAAESAFESVTESFEENPALTIGLGALTVGAVVFTGGAALGLGGAFAGGFGGSVAQGVAALGMEGTTVGSVMTGALTSAGYGTAIGAATAAVTGGDVLTGAAIGAGAGALSGGIGGLLASSGGGGAGGAAAGMTGGKVAAEMTETAMGDTTDYGVAGPQEPAVPPAEAPSVEMINAGYQNQPGGPGDNAGPGLFGRGGWVENNPELAGNIVQGLGAGLMASSREEAVLEAYKERSKSQERLEAQRRANYGTGGGIAPYRYAAGGSYEYDSRTGRIVRAA